MCDWPPYRINHSPLKKMGRPSRPSPPRGNNHGAPPSPDKKSNEAGASSEKVVPIEDLRECPESVPFDEQSDHSSLTDDSAFLDFEEPDDGAADPPPLSLDKFTPIVSPHEESKAITPSKSSPSASVDSMPWLDVARPSPSRGGFPTQQLSSSAAARKYGQYGYGQPSASNNVERGVFPTQELLATALRRRQQKHEATLDPTNLDGSEGVVPKKRGAGVAPSASEPIGPLAVEPRATGKTPTALSASLAAALARRRDVSDGTACPRRVASYAKKYPRSPRIKSTAVGGGIAGGGGVGQRWERNLRLRGTVKKRMGEFEGKGGGKVCPPVTRGDAPRPKQADQKPTPPPTCSEGRADEVHEKVKDETACTEDGGDFTEVSPHDSHAAFRSFQHRGGDDEASLPDSIASSESIEPSSWTGRTTLDGEGSFSKDAACAPEMEAVSSSVRNDVPLMAVPEAIVNNGVVQGRVVSNPFVTGSDIVDSEEIVADEAADAGHDQSPEASSACWPEEGTVTPNSTDGGDACGPIRPGSVEREGEREGKQPPPRDVAALIRNRILRVKHGASEDYDVPKPSTPEFLAIRARLRKIESGDSPVPLYAQGNRKDCAPSCLEERNSSSTLSTNERSSRSNKDASKDGQRSYGLCDAAEQPVVEKTMEPATNSNKGCVANNNTSKRACQPSGNACSSPPLVLSKTESTVASSQASVADCMDAETIRHVQDPCELVPVDKESIVEIQLEGFERCNEEAFGKALHPESAKAGGTCSSDSPQPSHPAQGKERDANEFVSNCNAQKSASSFHLKKAVTTRISKSNEVIEAKSSIQSTITDESPYDKYSKMLKVGLPLTVVHHAIARDGLSAEIFDVITGDDANLAKYSKMLKMGLPMAAVTHAMERDGIQLGGSIKKVENDPARDLRRTRVHWNKLDRVSNNSIWALVSNDPDVNCISIDEKEFAELFQTEQATCRSGTACRSVEPSPKQDGAVKIIDPKRANNGGIILARVKMSYDDIARAIDEMDDSALSAGQVRGLMEYAPTPEERTGLQTYLNASSKSKGAEADGLCECEKFMVALMNVAHPSRKLKALLFLIECKSLVAELGNDVSIIHSACDELRGSDSLPKLLGIILSIGNRLNTAGQSKEVVAGFALGSLLKLHVKAVGDRNTTILQYVVSVIERNSPLLLMALKDDLPSILPASKIMWDQCLDQLVTLEGQVGNAREIALFKARVLRDGANAMENIVLETARDCHDGDVLSDEQTWQLRSTKVGRFTLSAIESIARLRNQVEDVQQKFSCLLDYFGEGEEMMPHDIFHIMACFLKDVEDASIMQSKAAPAMGGKPHLSANITVTPQLQAAGNHTPSASQSQPNDKSGKKKKGKFLWRKRKDLAVYEV